MTTKFPVPPIENSPGFIIHHLDLLLKLGLHKSFQAEGINITAEQWAILCRLGEEEGVHQSAIAGKMGKDRHTITRMLNLLDKNGFVQRVPTDEDKRRLNVYLTASGRDILNKLVPICSWFFRKSVRRGNSKGNRGIIKDSQTRNREPGIAEGVRRAQPRYFFGDVAYHDV